MNRRTFSKTIAGATLGTAALALEPLGLAAGPAVDSNTMEAPFKISVMLWTILTDRPFENVWKRLPRPGTTPWN